MELSITNIILAVTVVVSFIAFDRRDVFQKLLLSPYMALHRNEWYRLLSHTLVHGGIAHLVVNMFVFHWSGRMVEQTYIGLKGEMVGEIYFIILYVGGAIFATLPSYAKHRNNPAYTAVGASGAVSSVLFAFILMYPTVTLKLYFLIPIYAIVLGILYLAYEWYMDKKGHQDNVAHDAHFYGAIFGIAFMIFVDPNVILDFGYLQKFLVQ